MSKQPFKQMSDPMIKQLINDGGTAFPHTTINNLGGFVLQPGMSLLDWFAGMAMQGILSNPIVRDPDTDIVAQDAYEVAKSMLSAKKGGRNEP